MTEHTDNKAECVELVDYTNCLHEGEPINTSSESISIAKVPKQQNTGKNPSDIGLSAFSAPRS